MKPWDQWTDEDLDALRAKFDAIMRGMIVTTLFLCAGMVLWVYAYRGMRALLGLF
jgi:hypothetical protein